MKPIITKQEAVTTYTITLTEDAMNDLINARGVASDDPAFDVLCALADAKMDADAEMEADAE